MICFAEHGPRELPGLRGARDLSVGDFGACVVRREGDVACFGFEHGTRDRPGARFTRPTIVSGTRGATQLSVPARLAAELGLQAGAPASVLTANGAVTVRQSRIPRLAFGPFEFRDVAGHLNPGMQGDEVLLGMSALRHLEFTQRGDTITLRAPGSG